MDVTKTVAEIKDGDTNQQVNIVGRVTLQGNYETVYTKGKTLKKQEATFTHQSGSMRIVLWENDIDKIISGQTYEIKKSW